MDTGPSERRHLMSQINVTPFVDVMLVLLIIFMVTTPMMQEGVDVNLPKVEAQAIKAEDEPLIVSIDSSRKIYLNGRQMRVTELKAKIEAISRAAKGKSVLLRADSSVPYGFIMEAMAEVRKAGIEKVGLVTEPERQ